MVSSCQSCEKSLIPVCNDIRRPTLVTELHIIDDTSPFWNDSVVVCGSRGQDVGELLSCHLLGSNSSILAPLTHPPSSSEIFLQNPYLPLQVLFAVFKSPLFLTRASVLLTFNLFQKGWAVVRVDITTDPTTSCETREHITLDTCPSDHSPVRLQLSFYQNSRSHSCELMCLCTCLHLPLSLSRTHARTNKEKNLRGYCPTFLPNITESQKSIYYFQPGVIRAHSHFFRWWDGSF